MGNKGIEGYREDDDFDEVKNKCKLKSQVK